MQNVGRLLPDLVDVAGPPDQPAFLAPVSPTGLEFSSSIGHGKNSNLERPFGRLDALNCRASRHKEPGQQHPEKSSVTEHRYLLRNTQAWEAGKPRFVSTPSKHDSMAPSGAQGGECRASLVREMGRRAHGCRPFSPGTGTGSWSRKEDGGPKCGPGGL
jgi:hypothetical protein